MTTTTPIPTMPTGLTGADDTTAYDDTDEGGRHLRLLLAGGLLAGPVFMGSTLTQAATRDGFDMRRHAASLLSNGDLGWIQALTFALTGIAVTAAARGIGRTTPHTASGRWVGRLLTVFGVSFLSAAIFPADPTMGFPVGTPDGVGPITATGAAHMASGMVGFFAVILASSLLARSQLRSGERLRGMFSAATAALFLLAIIGIMSGSGSASAGLTLGFWAAIACSFAWLATTSMGAARAHTHVEPHA
jgi:hypothetical protein